MDNRTRRASECESIQAYHGGAFFLLFIHEGLYYVKNQGFLHI